jgi:hypothetical protein
MTMTSEADEPRCESITHIQTFIGPTFEASRNEFFRCIRERGHVSDFHFGPPVDDAFGAYATWRDE